MIIVDLFSGYGGASEAFVEAGDDVRRFEIDPTVTAIVPHSQTLDLTGIESYWKIERALERTELDLVWASPPCREFSRAYNAPQAVAEREGSDYTPTNGLIAVERAKAIIDALKPKYWVIENVAGSRKWLEPILGPPTQVIGPYVLWGNFPRIVVPSGVQFQPKNMKAGGHDRHSVQKRSVVPIEISRGLRTAMIEQKTLDAWWA